MKNILLITTSVIFLVNILLFVNITFKAKTTFLAKNGALITLGFALMFLYLLYLNDTHILYVVGTYAALHLTNILNELAIHEKLSFPFHQKQLMISLIIILLFYILL